VAVRLPARRAQAQRHTLARVRPVAQLRDHERHADHLLIVLEVVRALGQVMYHAHRNARHGLGVLPPRVAVHGQKVRQRLAQRWVALRLGVEVGQDKLLEQVAVAERADEHELAERDAAVGLHRAVRRAQTPGEGLVYLLDERVLLVARVGALREQRVVAAENVADDLERDDLERLVALGEAVQEERQVLLREILSVLDHYLQVINRTLLRSEHKPRHTRPRSRIGASWLRTAGTTRLFNMVTR
jgi:hypothetical protein